MRIGCARTLKLLGIDFAEAVTMALAEKMGKSTRTELWNRLAGSQKEKRHLRDVIRGDNG